MSIFINIDIFIPGSSFSINSGPLVDNFHSFPGNAPRAVRWGIRGVLGKRGRPSGLR